MKNEELNAGITPAVSLCIFFRHKGYSHEIHKRGAKITDQSLRIQEWQEEEQEIFAVAANP